MKRFSFIFSILFIIGGIIFLAGLQSCKHEPKYQIDQNINPETPNPVTDTSTKVTLNGRVLYQSYCESCHGIIDSSTKLGATANQIQNGISSIASMKTLSTLTIAQVQAIADALKTNLPSQDTSTNGVKLYATYCASCHNPLSSSTKLGVTASQIQTGIANVVTMNSLSSLTILQIQAIADALKTNQPPIDSTDGAALYANYCASCHNPLATSSKLGATESNIQNAISTVGSMQTLSSLTTTQLQAIADVLASTPMPTDGASLYAINCASCHNPLANSQVGGSSVSDIQSAINDVNKMKSLSKLTVSQIQAIAGVLATVSGGDN
jgi:mono/diheme cytochrome c family protein